MNFRDKIKSRKEIIALARRFKKDGKTVVTWNGSFDIMHSAHLAGLLQAKRQGDVLIILLNSDKSVTSYKGPGRPIIPERERALLLAAMESVDYVVIFNELNPKKILGEIKPNVHINGADWGRNCVERGVVEANGGRIYILKPNKGPFTSDIVKKIVAAEKIKTIRVVFWGIDPDVRSVTLLRHRGYGVVADASQRKINHALQKGVNLSASWLVSHDPRDILLGREMNIKTIKLGATMPREMKLDPHYYAKNMRQAIAHILS